MSSSFMNTDISQISTYDSGIAQATAHRVINRIVSDYLFRHDLTSMQWFIVGHIYDAGEEGVRISDVMQKLQTTLPYITNTITLLESKNIVRKIPHVSDNRTKMVSIVPDYIPTLVSIESELREYLRTTLYREDGITREELTTYIRVLYKIAQSSQ